MRAAVGTDEKQNGARRGGPSWLSGAFLIWLPTAHGPSDSIRRSRRGLLPQCGIVRFAGFVVHAAAEHGGLCLARRAARVDPVIALRCG
jgi:hypothetical protein